MDVVPDGDVRYGFPNIADNAEIVELIASGCHLILVTKGRGSVVGSAISPVINIGANPDTFGRLRDNVDVNAGRILTQFASIDYVCGRIFGMFVSVAAGHFSRSEELDHQEFI